MSNSEYSQVGRFTGLSKDYLQLRVRVSADAKQMSKVSPCQKGMAYCCEGHVEVSMEEGQEIIDAAKKGKIPEGVIDRVRENLDDESNNMCPFLGKNRSCMIYDRRPLECVNFGRGAVIVTEEGREQYKEIGQGIREDGIQEPDVIPRLCGHCRALRDPDVSYSRDLLISSQSTVAYYQLQPVIGKLTDVAVTITTGEFMPFYPNPKFHSSVKTLLDSGQTSASE
ncbi:MAG: putative zinc- or iron-chelating domain [Candidatus Parcubacteria bacterium]|jgi:Fe-S-cluster containining protein